MMCIVETVDDEGIVLPAALVHGTVVVSCTVSVVSGPAGISISGDEVVFEDEVSTEGIPSVTMEGLNVM